MKRFSLVLLALVCLSSMFAQAPVPAVTAAQASQMVGQVVTVEDVVCSARTMWDSKGQPTYLNLGAAYPYQHLTVVVWQNLTSIVTSKLLNTYSPRELERGIVQHRIRVTGLVTEYKGKAQIEVNSINNIEPVKPAEVQP